MMVNIVRHKLLFFYKVQLSIKKAVFMNRRRQYFIRFEKDEKTNRHGRGLWKIRQLLLCTGNVMKKP